MMMLLTVGVWFLHLLHCQLHMDFPQRDVVGHTELRVSLDSLPIHWLTYLHISRECELVVVLHL